MSLHDENQRLVHEATFGKGSRHHVNSTNPLVQYVTRWRLEEAVRRLARETASRITRDSSIVVSCAGEGLEGTVLCDLGFRDVTVTDITESGVREAIRRDLRLKGQSANAEQLPFDDGSFDLAVVQDGLHHLSNPVRGFTELLRVSRTAVIFLEPHDSLVGRLIGTKWERNGVAVNYVFRWTRRLVQDVTCSYLGPEEFTNCSFSFWHHNPSFGRLGAALGGGRGAIEFIRATKWALDTSLGRWGNQFCGIVVRSNASRKG